ncbi:LOW QUALITY PROTEIN: uncharacterized protein LOC110230264 [Arabidopsis lyrata subsp. lyrata]|uniref:LOW QUALITY PROTEIN: uncharacterized protein LOC110230264 n=1 Tax=Arabidopsis lyrata subsp. lyrata TaxID=81972 RepID=UPI000A29AA55|nr:LOW QUALITY PROTEIN: uncharacterized protein LOC110230264 [Arabidopsis lyrata subsp. lyrata]|eukprot:XP_020888322.1 LOW QUALITY PROTEIN: uncharacterized protein LOC110230264 [Arabidopsis lyrata subsp. lyrata]
MGDSKRQKTETKMEMEKVEKIEKEESRPVDFAELRDDLFREAAKLVSEFDPSTKIAIFVTPPPSSSESDVSMYSFGFPSVSGVVNTFLQDNCPEEEEEEDEDDEDDAEVEDCSAAPQRFWWEDGKQFESMNPEQLDAAYQRLARLRDRMILELELRAQGSGNHKDLHNDKAADPKP